MIESPNLGRDDAVLITLHGHGVQFEFEETVTRNGKDEIKKTPRFYFCPADAAVAGVTKANDITERHHLLPLDELYRKLEGCSAATRLLIVDACRNDPTKPRGIRELASVTRPVIPPPPGGIAAFFSCKATQRALEDKDLQQGVFTHFLIQGLSGRADQPLEGEPADGIVTLSELTSYVSNNTYSHVLKKFPGHQQSPDMKGEFDTTLPLVRLPPPKRFRSPSTGIEFALIPAGEFEMGSRMTPKELAAKFSQWNAVEAYFEDECPPNRVKIPQFYLGQHEVTVGQFRQFVTADSYQTEAEADGKGGYGFDEAKATFVKDPKYTWRNPGFTQADDHPVVNVSWNDAQRFCVWLRDKEGTKYRLPTEAEWEYACKAGTNTLWWNGDDPEATAKIGNVADGTAKAKFDSFNAISARDGYVFTAPVGKFPANPFGLFDMHGNVFEWCEDVYDAKLCAGRSGTTENPRSSSGSEYRVLRGGSWFFEPLISRSAYRTGDTPDNRIITVGFRLARTR